MGNEPAQLAKEKMKRKDSVRRHKQLVTEHRRLLDSKKSVEKSFLVQIENLQKG
jgi:hypothetical protein